MLYPYIRESTKFYGKYEVVVSEDYIIPCYNYSTAKSIMERIIYERNKKT